MRVLIATTELQATAPGDYSFTVEGELVTPVVAVCSTPDDCGCNRGFPGLASGQATTTAMVVDRPFIGVDDLRDAVTAWLERSGWDDLLSDPGLGVPGADPRELFDDVVAEHVEVIGEVCAAYPVGTVIERSGNLVSSRIARKAA